jgi:type IV secretory pathway TraG/TraD family ATPase VirD4
MDRIYSEKGRKAIFTSAAALIVTQIGNDLDTARYLSDLSG